MIAALAGAVSIAAFAAIFIIALTGQITGRFGFWPPPPGGGWQSTVFRTLFRLGFYPLVLASLILLHETTPGVGRAALSGGLILAGFGGAFWTTRHLGWNRAFGGGGGLVTDGPFAWSRNPIYACTLAGLVGWAVLLPVPLVRAALALWGGLYLIAPYLEEPWLRARHGDAYISYCCKVRRFF